VSVEGAGATVGLAEAGSLHRFSHDAMATVFEVRAVHADAAYARQAAHAGFELVDRLEQELSRFIPNSDIARINSLSAGHDTRVSPDTMECLVIARHLYTLTNGAFDVSLGSGLDRLELEADELSVRALGDGVRLDLGGIGKGYAVDRLAALLEEWGLDRALVHGGWSSVLALEPPPDRDAWPLTLSAPGPGVARLLARVPARQRALSASGTRKGEHILDPRTGQSVADGAVWVALPRSRDEGHSPAAVADALSTAFMVLPRERIEALCLQNPDLDAWLLVETSPGEPAVVRLGASPSVRPGG
jgi:thiamine biosynthesis lipoprotein